MPDGMGQASRASTIRGGPGPCWVEVQTLDPARSDPCRAWAVLGHYFKAHWPNTICGGFGPCQAEVQARGQARHGLDPKAQGLRVNSWGEGPFSP